MLDGAHTRGGSHTEAVAFPSLNRAPVLEFGPETFGPGVCPKAPAPAGSMVAARGFVWQYVGTLGMNPAGERTAPPLGLSVWDAGGGSAVARVPRERASASCAMYGNA